MALLRPNKGTGPATGKVKPSRAELLMSATQALASEQLPDKSTMSAIEKTPDDTASDSRPQPAADTPPVASARPLEVRDLPLDAIRPSPFQPKGRPSTAAVDEVRTAIARAGSIEALVSPEGATTFTKLSAESARLAELAYDILEHGLKVPVEVRTLETGDFECLSGHRRIAAAKLAGLTLAPAIDRGEMSNAAAAATVLRGNLHRENFTTWQEAALVAEVQERRRADGFRDNVRTLGAVMGWSHGKVNMLLRIRKSLPPALLARAGGGDAGLVEERLARTPYRDLERLAAEPDDARRLAALRRLLGLGEEPPATGTSEDRPACVHRPKRGGGFVLEVHAPVESLAAGDAAVLRTHLETQLTRVKARLASLGHV